MAARILAVADVYDALTTKRVYKPPIHHDQAVEIIRKDSGSHFDPDIVEAFHQCKTEFLKLAIELSDDSRAQAGHQDPDWQKCATEPVTII